MPNMILDKFIVDEMTTMSPMGDKTIREVRVYEAVKSPDGTLEKGRMVQQHVFVNGDLVTSTLWEEMPWSVYCERYKGTKYKNAATDVPDPA